MAGPQEQTHTDIQSDDWVDRLRPAFLRPYLRLARLDRPIGSWLLFFPCAWAVALADAQLFVSWQGLLMVALFGAGSIIMRGAGCTINDMWDRRIDRKIERTAVRPLASGQLSLKRAFLFLFLQLILGAMVLLQFNTTTILLGISWIALVVLYPLMKRITWWPQAFLGLTFNWGALVGWAAVTGTVSETAIWLYAAGFFWTLGYDTIYAHQDIRDDEKTGVKSLARRLGAQSKIWIAGFYVCTLVCLEAALLSTGVSSVASFLLLPVCLHFLWQLKHWDMADPANSLYWFKSNRWTGWLILAVCVATQASL